MDVKYEDGRTEDERGGHLLELFRCLGIIGILEIMLSIVYRTIVDDRHALSYSKSNISKGRVE